MYRSYVRSLSILEQAKMGLLDDYLTFQEISILTYPDGMPAQRKKLQKELLEYYEWGKLIARKGAYDEALNALVLPGISHKEAFPRTGLKSDYWVHHQDFRELLEINSNWPVDRDLPLTKWFIPKPQRAVFYKDIEELPEEQRLIVREKWQIAEDKGIAHNTDKLEILPQTRECELHELIKDVYITLQSAGNRRPTSQKIWNYIEDNYKNIDLVDEVTEDCIFWTSYGGTQQKQKITTFQNTCTKARKAFPHKKKKISLVS